MRALWGLTLLLAVCSLSLILGCRRADGVGSQASADPTSQLTPESGVAGVVNGFLDAVRREDWARAAEFFCADFRKAHQSEILSGKLLAYDPQGGKTPQSILHSPNVRIVDARIGRKRAQVWLQAGGRATRAQVGMLALELAREGGEWRLRWLPPPREAYVTRSSQQPLLAAPPGERVEGFVPGDTARRSALACPSISHKQCPALVFLSRHAGQSHLYVAHFTGGTAHRQEIMSAHSLQLAQLDDATFLATATDSGETPKVVATDLRSGRITLLAYSCRIHCLRAGPERQKAMLMSVDMSIPEVKLIELDLTTFEMASWYTLSRALLGDKFDGIRPGMALSPDFKHIAYGSPSGWTGKAGHGSPTYVLRVLDLSTMRVADLEDDLCVEVSSLSSMGPGGLPVEWLSNRTIIYQHVIPTREKARYRTNGVHILKIVDIHTRKISQCLREELRLSMHGGSLRANPLNGEIIYRNEWLVDIGDRILRRKDHPFSVERGYRTKPTTILHGDSVLYRGTADCEWPCVSASRKHFAYALDPPERGPVVIYAKIDGIPVPIRVAEGTQYPTRPIAWIEDTRPLRQRSKD